MSRNYRKRPVAVEEDEMDIDPAPPLPVETEEDDIYSRLGSMLDELKSSGGEAYLNVYSMPRSGQRNKAFLMHCGAGDYSLGDLFSLLQSNYGAGEYEIVGMAGGRIRARRRVTIAAPPKKPESVEAESQVKTLAEFLQTALRQQTETMAGLLGQFLTKVETPRVDPMDLQRQTISMLASMREVFAPSPPVQPSQPLGNTLAQLKELMEVRDFLRGDADPGEQSSGDALLKMAEKFLPALVAAGQAAPASVNTRKVGEPHLQSGVTTLNRQTVKESPAMKEFVIGIKFLLDGAKRNSDPELYAELIADKFEEDQVSSFLSADNYIERLALFVPEVKNYREWFDRLRAVLLNWIDNSNAAGPSPESGEHAGSITGNPTGTGGNATNT